MQGQVLVPGGAQSVCSKIYAFQELWLGVKSEIDTNNSKIGCVKSEQRGTEKSCRKNSEKTVSKAGSLWRAEGPRWGQTVEVAIRAKGSWH